LGRLFTDETTVPAIVWIIEKACASQSNIRIRLYSMVRYIWVT